jgi:CheY-like chemotaxis protein
MRLSVKILIVDDDEGRASGLREYLSRSCSISADEILFVDCLSDARRLLRNVYFDVLILDVVLPKRKDKKRPHHLVGIGLLEELSRQSHLKKPEKIIGITAHIEDISKFRTEFEQSCNIVVEAPSNSDVWKAKISSALSYTGVSKTSRAVALSRTAVLSVHGIRTFGQWQTRLRRLIEARTDAVSFHTYKFGYFSSLLFLIPWIRNIQVERLKNDIEPIIKDSEFDRVYIFCHSFGTYLVAYSLLKIFDAENVVAKTTLVLCGSILPSNFDWRKIDSGKALRVINDCGDRDYVLWLSAAFVLGVGMAGKVGFYGFSNDFIMNRFFNGGHSSYFRGDDFMLKYWLPLLDDVPVISEVDERQNASFAARLGEKTVEFVSTIKPWIYLVLGLALLLFVARGFGAG